MSAEDLEKYETEMELQLYKEYRDIVGQFTYVVETERRFYLANAVDVQVRNSDSEVYFEVAMSDAWQKGAQQLTEEQRRDFANDPLNLLAVAGWANQQKGDGDTATWLPPRREFRCSYVSRQVLVKDRYGLWVTQAERDAMDRVLAGC